MSIAAVIQMVSGDDIEGNLASAGDLLNEAAGRNAEIAVLPENFAVFNTGQMISEGACEVESSGRIRSFLSRKAADLGIWIVGGTIPSAVRPDGTFIKSRVRSVCRIYNSSGIEISRYDKIHLFDAQVGDSHGIYRESDELEHGEDIIVADTPAGPMGLAVCYDLRFPELFSALRSRGAEVIAIPSAFTKKTGDAHWEILVRARAIETQTWLLAPNQGGVNSDKKETSGNSMIVDPWGRVVKSIKRGEGVITAEIDLKELGEIRSAMPVNEHKKISL
jgi:nitrilase